MLSLTAWKEGNHNTDDSWRRGGGTREALRARRAAVLAKARSESSSKLRLVRGRRNVARPFELQDPAAFVATVGALGTDVLVLFYSPTCSDCEALMPYWDKVAAHFEKRLDITVLSVADTDAIAPSPYKHYENPAVFFARRGAPDDPVAFPGSAMQAFLNGQDYGIDADLENFAEQQASNGPNPLTGPVTLEPQQPQSHALPSPRAPAASADASHQQPESYEQKLDTRFLAVLQQHAGESTKALLDIAKSDAYKDLPVARFLVEEVAARGGKTPEPVAGMAARFLDGLPQAQDWAASYAQWYSASQPGITKEQLEIVAQYALSYYGRSVYEQRLR